MKEKEKETEREREREEGKGRKWKREKVNAKRPGSQGPLVHSHGGNQERREKERKQNRQGGRERKEGEGTHFNAAY